MCCTNVSSRGYRSRVDTGVILYAAELQAPALRETALRILETEARRFGVRLDGADVLGRRTGTDTRIHIVAAAYELLARLVAAEADPLGDSSSVMALARAGALALMTRLEMDQGSPACH